MDELYIRKVLDGDIDAFKYFVQQYKDFAFAVAVSVVKNEFEAKDIVQEAFILAFRNLKSFKSKSKFSTWFYRIVVNEALKHANKNPPVASTGPESPGERPEAVAHSVNSFDDAHQKYYIDLAMKHIPAREALVLSLFYLKEYQVEEISNITGWSVSNIKVNLFRARKSFYHVLSKLLKTEKERLY